MGVNSTSGTQEQLFQYSIPIVLFMEMENLEILKYKDLQKLAKEAGIKANSPKAVLIEALKGFRNKNEGAPGPSGVKEEENLSIEAAEESKLNETFEKIDVEAQNKMNETF